MTYGWAILVVLAAIGALAYFGILSPSKFLPNSCTLSGGFSCTQYKVTADNVTLGVQNNLGVDADSAVVSFTSTDCVGAIGAPITFTAISNGQPLLPMPSFTCDLSGKTKMKGTFNITYTRSGEQLSHTTTGMIQSGVET